MKVLEFPFSGAALREFDSAGVYLFSELLPDQIKEITNGKELGDLNFKMLQIAYVGKAKMLRSRLRSYIPRMLECATEAHKLSLLQQNCRSVLLLPFPSHFEACVQEIYLIRLLNPWLNYTSTAASRVLYLRNLKGRLKLQTHLPAKRDLMGFFTSARDARETLALFSMVLWALKTGSSFLPFSACSFARTSELFLGKLAMPVVDPETQETRILDDDLTIFFKGKKSFFQKRIWHEMHQAALAQHFRKAASLRDLFFSMQRFQRRMVFSRRLLARFKNAEFLLEEENNSTSFFVKSYEVSGTFVGQNDAPFSQPILDRGGRESNRRGCAGPGQLAKGKGFEKNPSCHLTSTLRINYEILRLMLLWHTRQIEPCLLRRASLASQGIAL